MTLHKINELSVGAQFKYKGFPAEVKSRHSWNEYVGETQKGIKLFDRGFVVYFSYTFNEGETDVVLRTNHPDTKMVNMKDYSL